jgi:hypothetical protein
MAKMRKRNLAAAAAAAVVCGLATGCGEDGPFSLTVTHVNESGPQRNAVIAISDPQIYTRERLLNDREQEIAYLTTQIQNIDSQNFTPRLKRDLDELAEVAVALSAKFNPIAGAEVTQAAQVNELSNDIQIERLKNLLGDVKEQQTAADAGAVGTTPATTNTTGLDAAPLGEVIKNTQALLTALQTRIDKQNPKGRAELRDNSVTSATPIEVLRDKLAYRNELQSALEQAQLDNRHDMNGNALYRLQFKATVFPGQVKDKYGVARLTVLPPEFDGNGGVSKLYLDWLSYVASELNPFAPGSAGKSPTAPQLATVERYELLGPATGMYQVAWLPTSGGGAAGGVQTDATLAFVKSVAPADAIASANALTDDCDKLIDLLAQPGVSSALGTTKEKAGNVAIPMLPAIDERTVWAIGTQKCAEHEAELLQNVAKLLSQKNLQFKWEAEDRSCYRLQKRIGEKGDWIMLDLKTPEGSDFYYRRLAAGLATNQLKATNTILAGSDDTPTDAENLRTAIIFARNVYNLTPTYLLAIQRVERLSSGDANTREQLDKYTKSLFSLRVAAEHVLATLKDGLQRTQPAAEADGIPCYSFQEVAGRIWVPDSFYAAVTSPSADHYSPDGTGRFYAGESYAYSTAPAELAQRVSTVASATQALDLMASVSAIIPQAGAGINAASEVQQIASGHVDAIESAPLIVGFSNAGAMNLEGRQYGAEPSEPSFGWVFGPKVIVDSEKSKLALSQVLVEQPVTADISVPGWWTRLRLRVETAWAANFESSMLAGAAYNGKSDPTRQPKNRVSDYVIDVPLQTSPASFEQLTEFLANKTWGLQYKLPVVTGIRPATVLACAGSKLLISGTDLWRGTKVYLNAVRAEPITIMPDMQGVEATFDLSSTKPGKAALTVWTQLGQVDGGSVVIAACSTKPDAVTPKLKPEAFPIVIAGLPMKVSTDAKIVQGTKYRAVIRMADKSDAPLYIDADPGNLVADPKGVFTIPIPKADAFAKAFKIDPLGKTIPNTGTELSLEIRSVDRDNPDILASIGPLFFYETTIEDFFKVQGPKIKAINKTGSDDYTLNFPLPPKFTDAYAKDVVADISGFSSNGTATVLPSKPVVIASTDDGQTGNITFTLDKGWTLPAGQPITVKLMAGKTPIGSFTKAVTPN